MLPSPLSRGAQFDEVSVVRDESDESSALLRTGRESFIPAILDARAIYGGVHLLNLALNNVVLFT